MEMYAKSNQADNISVKAGRVVLRGNISIPEGSTGIVIFAHGSGSSRTSARNQYVARNLNEKGIATLLFDLLTQEEEETDLQNYHLRFDIPLLAQRLVDATEWIINQPKCRGMKVGYFGASTGGGAALVAASQRPDVVKAVVSRGGRPDLAGQCLQEIKCPVLLIVGEKDEQVIELNRLAISELTGEKKLEIVLGATHLFEGKGKLEEVASLACSWFLKYLGGVKRH